ncbi:hypothetical protein GCM10010449_54120 [Streptomyces rectiviolaceus]|uniref:Uncharacterized protein n=1 Tax=Streptomyces rectiviolaceus TaxID=332591 RepID=A0ABP6MU34_9ACTN
MLCPLSGETTRTLVGPPATACGAPITTSVSAAASPATDPHIPLAVRIRIRIRMSDPPPLSGTTRPHRVTSGTPPEPFRFPIRPTEPEPTSPNALCSSSHWRRSTAATA